MDEIPDKKILTPRPYQLELVEYICQRNGIIYLPTGAGKTFVAILALRRYAHTLQNTIQCGGKRAIFMCNTVELARQQAKEIKKTTNLKVGLYIGDRDVDNWGRRKWEEEIVDKQVLVGTAQIFVDIISQNLIKVTDLSIVMIDECHHATGNHPMHAFLGTFQHCDQTKLPRVIGLTGVLIKGNKLGNVLEDLRKLEATLRGNIITVRSTEQMKNVMVFSTKPKEQMVSFSQPDHHFQVESKIERLVEECKSVIDNWDIGTIGIKMSKGLGKQREPNKKNSIKNLLADFVYQMTDFGLYTASLAIMSPIIEFEVKKRQAETLALRNLYRLAIQYCERIRHVIVKELASLTESTEEEDSLDIILNYSTPKLRSLFSYIRKTFKDKRPEDIACLLFVERRYTAKCVYHVLLRYIAHVPELRHIIRPQFMVGRQNIITSIESILDSKWNNKAIDQFRSGECNLIICSNVLEEGIDVQACNYVFVFDQLKTFNSYIQTKGRARSQNSSYVVFTPEIESHKTLIQIRKYLETHEQIKQFLMTRILERDDPHEDAVSKEFVELIPPYVIPSGARLLATSALALLHRYCQQLPWDSFGASQPWYLKMPQRDDGKMAVSVKLPLQSTVKETIMSDYFVTSKDAKISAAFKACIKLYENGELNHMLLPITKSECIAKVADSLFQHWKKYDDDVTKKTAGKQLKRTYERQCPDELQNSLPRLGEKAYAYSIQFSIDFENNSYNDHICKYLKSKTTYALLLNKKLPKLAKMPLFMTQGQLNVTISHEPIECVLQTEEQLNLLKQFHTMIFRDLLQLWKEFIGKDHRNLENSYLIIPLDSLPSIDWQLIKKFQRLNPSRRYSQAERKNAQYRPNDYLNKVVTKWYSDLESENFVVTKIREDLTPMSMFDNKSFGSFADFYANRYNVDVINKNQFLLEVKSLTKRRNFFNNASNKSAEKKKEQNSIVLIPELCHNYQYPADLWLKALFLPTILHRVYYMLHAEALRKRINHFLGLDKYFNNYTPQPLVLDISLKRVLDDNGNLVKDKVHPKRLLPPLPTKRQTRDYVVHSLDSEDNEATWKSYLEPVDLSRQIDKSFEVEIDYYTKFLKGLVSDMDNLRLEEELEWTKTQFEMPDKCLAIQSNATTSNLNKIKTLSIKDATVGEKSSLDILKRSFEPDQSLKSAEQYEFLAALTTAHVNDIFDMERFEMLGDAFLKFSVSLYLANKYGNCHEGFLTIIKGRIVSNRNLLYCLMGTDICKRICGMPFSPNTAWLPPLSSLPENLLDLFKRNLPEVGLLSPRDFYSLELTENEIEAGKCAQIKLERFVHTCIETKNLTSANVELNPDNDMNIYIYKDVLSDKVVADTLEALLGVCVKNYGLHRTFRMLEFFDICKSESANPLTNLLDLKLSSAQLRTNITATEVDGFLLNYKFLEKNLGYTFRDRAFLLQALTHPSYPTNRLTGCYQELEFIGDAILDMLVTCFIFEKFQHMTPGKMTDLRMALVNNITLGCICVRHRFHLFLLYENAALSESIANFVKFQETQNYRVTDQVRILMEENNETINPYNDFLNDSNEDDDSDKDDNDFDDYVVDVDEQEQQQQQQQANAASKTDWPQPKKTYNMATNVDVPKALGDIVEALIAAVYLDCRDLNRTWQVIYHLMAIEINEFSNNVPIDPVRQLAEIKQASPKYSPPLVDNDVVMVKCVFNCLDKSYTSNGFGCNAKQAKKAAAKQALQILKKHSN